MTVNGHNGFTVNLSPDEGAIMVHALHVLLHQWHMSPKPAQGIDVQKLLGKITIKLVNAAEEK